MAKTYRHSLTQEFLDAFPLFKEPRNITNVTWIEEHKKEYLLVYPDRKTRDKYLQVWISKDSILLTDEIAGTVYASFMTSFATMAVVYVKGWRDGLKHAGSTL